MSIEVCDSTGSCKFRTPDQTIAINGLNNGPTLQSITFKVLFSHFDTGLDDSLANKIYLQFGNTNDSLKCEITLANSGGTATCGTVGAESATVQGISAEVSSVPSVANNEASGTLNLKLNFTNRNLTAADIGNPTETSTASLIVGFDSGNSQPLLWQIDQGGFNTAPNLKSFSYDSAFEISWGNSFDLSAQCVNDGTGKCANAPTNANNTFLSTNNSLSGFLIGFWKQETAAAVNLNLAPNPELAIVPENTTPSNAGCTSPLNFDTSFLGCSAVNYSLIVPDQSFDILTTATPNLTPDQLKSLVNNPGSIITDGNMNYEFVSADQTTWVYKPPEGNGTRYGVTMWLLNSAENLQSNIFPNNASTAVPNYSFKHSPISYAIASESSGNLASLAKDSGLSLTTSDCFVVTAASGNPDSLSVFYWRAIRDRYLTPLGITKYYYKHSRNWARILNEHPSYKKPLNSILEKSGSFIYHTDLYWQKAKDGAKKSIKKYAHILNQLIFPEANAEDLQEHSKVIQNKKVPHIIQPAYEFGFQGGVFFPTEDEKYFSSRYGKNFFLYQVTAQGTYNLWMGNIGLYLGGSASLSLKSKERTSDPFQNCCGPTPDENMETQNTSLRYLTALGMLGVRYRSLRFPYLQLGFYTGGGVSHLREETVPRDAPSDAQQAPKGRGITEYQPQLEAGGNFDVSLYHLANITDATAGLGLKDLLFRVHGAYGYGIGKAVTLTGFSAQAGFSFLFQ